MFIINTLLGFLTIQIADVLSRSKSSEKSPIKWCWSFFWKDNKVKIVFSLLLSAVLSLTVYFNFDAAISESEWANWNGLLYWAIGATPEYILQRLKKKLGIFQPDEVDTDQGTFKRL